MARVPVLRCPFRLDLRHHGNFTGIEKDVDLKVVTLMQVGFHIRHPKSDGIRGKHQFRTSGNRQHGQRGVACDTILGLEADKLYSAGDVRLGAKKRDRRIPFIIDLDIDQNLWPFRFCSPCMKKCDVTQSGFVFAVGMLFTGVIIMVVVAMILFIRNGGKGNEAKESGKKQAHCVVPRI